MATIWKRKTGKKTGWTARVRRAGHSVSKTFRTRREAEAWAADIEAQRAGVIPKKSSRTLHLPMR